MISFENYNACPIWFDTTVVPPTQVNLAILAPAVGAVLAGKPLSLIGLTRPHWGHGPSSPQELDPRAVDQQVQRPRSAAVGDLHSKGILPAAQGGEVRHRPVEPCHRQDAGHHAISPWSLGPVAFSWLDLPKRQAKPRR